MDKLKHLFKVSSLGVAYAFVKPDDMEFYGPYRRGWRYDPKWNRITFDRQLGFDNKRKEWKPKSTPEDWDSYKLDPYLRGPCADFVLDRYDCRRDHGILMGTVMCSHEKEMANWCFQQLYELRIMEAEREKRLRLREARRLKRQQEMEAAAAQTC